MAEYITGYATLLESIDKKVVILLRDERTLTGILRSVDHFANLVLSSTTEYFYHENEYALLSRGVFFIRGENVALCGELKTEAESKMIEGLTLISVEQILKKKAKNLERLAEIDPKIARPRNPMMETGCFEEYVT